MQTPQFSFQQLKEDPTYPELPESALHVGKRILQEFFPLQQGESGVLQVNVIFCDALAMESLNEQYRGQKSPTDVLSFAYGVEVEEESLPVREIGEIFLCVPYIREQATQVGNSLEQEMAFLFFHGLLHLCGFAHGQPEEKQRMFALQQRFFEEWNG
ncbi:MAG TPA: rRNA maturation RNase YbeY [Thermotogota bacterium]|nr:rRNA maturation RNase YbeY [Thermotogota bacterium]HRW91783.1 rRNA maturation RNase YbeY [Thermotogota bacterium]